MRQRDAPVGVFVALIVLLAVIGIGILLYFRNTRIDFGDGELSRTTMFGRTTTVAVSDIGTVLSVRSLMAFMAPTTENVFVLDSAGRLVVRATDQQWTRTQMRSLVAATGQEPVVIEKPINSLAIRARYPLAVAWWEAHPFRTAFIAVGVFTVLFFAGYAVYTSDLRWMVPQFFAQWRFRLGFS
ncbi:hypothetical protein B0I08_10312 [Glaciihabitans tibetensis]|uniref:Uncharacterized protein n=1 Tax=Glaciihabitans tibetensis TaxID=1266600 RepID=A0A2T0VF27_9MICO|nr:hypothetical protein [Glaciihabitans tibetensis]PRY68808.1 hypothetical protein B0I08_10312 [Glaciihabitans tibetensis]